MSAIGAIFSNDGVPPFQIEAMQKSLSMVPHDSLGGWASGVMALSAATLHTTAQSREHSQSIITENDQFALVFAGYLQNPDELRSDLEAAGFALRNNSDGEIALKAYQAWGDGCADRLHDEFSFIIADQVWGRLFAARDHMGFVPLYYMVERGRLVLASDFRTLASLSKKPLTPNPHYLAQIMTNRWYLREDTPWKEVKRVVRAHTMSFDGKLLEHKRYWTPPTQVTIRHENEADYVEEYKELLFDSVKRVSRSDRPVGVAVSGGLDSSALYLIGDRLEKSSQWLAPGLKGYSLAAEEGGNAFELPYARAAARHVGRELVEVPLFDPDIEWYEKDAQWHHDIAIPSNGAMMLDMEKRVIADGGRVIINGIGGDEWLTGNNLDYREYVRDRDAASFRNAFRRDWTDFGLVQALNVSTRQLIGEVMPESMRRPLRALMRKRHRQKDKAFNWLSADLRDALAQAEEQYEQGLPEPAVEWAKHNMATSPFSDLSYSLMYRQRSRIGLESRHPMLSRKFIEFSLRTPINTRRRGRLTKYVHRKAMAGILPELILNRESKANFTNTKIDTQYADYTRANAKEYLSQVTDIAALESILSIDFTSEEGDYWAWEIWGLYATAAFYISRNA